MLGRFWDGEGVEGQCELAKRRDGLGGSLFASSLV
jgi:hypothetical protein